MKRFSFIALVLGATLAHAHAPVDTTARPLDNVVVTGTRNSTDVRHLPMTISIVNREALIRNFRQSVLPTLSEQVPGLFVSSRGMLGYGVSTGSAGGIKVRGVGSGAALLVLVDGLPQYAGLYGHPIADAYQTMLAERVEVLRGPASMIYGSNAMGGVVNIVTRKMEHDGLSGNLNLQGGSYGTLEATAGTRFRSGKFFGIASANYGRTDGHRPNSEFEQTAGFLKLGYDFTPHWTLSGNIDLTYFENSNPGPVSAPIIDNDMMITRGMTALSLTNEYDRTSGAIRVFYNWGHHHINDGYQQGGTPRTAFYLHDDKMGGISIYQSAALFAGNRTTLGLDYLHFGGEAWNRAMANGSRTPLAHASINEISGYLDFRQTIASRLTLDAGLRIDHQSVTGTEYIPQGGLTLLLPRNIQLKAIVSKGFRNPTVRELYMFRPANAELQPERLTNYELAYTQSLMQNRLRIAANIFYLKADNLITTAVIAGRPRNVNTGATENSGFELEIEYRPTTHLLLNANYSHLHMSRPQLAAPEHKLNAAAQYEIGRFGINANLQWVGKLHTAIGANPQTENFTLLNLTAHYRPTRHLRIFAKGENLLAQRYEILAGFPLPRATFMGGIDWNF